MKIIYKLVQKKSLFSWRLSDVLNVEFAILLIEWLSVCFILVYATRVFVQRTQSRKKDVSVNSCFLGTANKSCLAFLLINVKQFEPPPINDGGSKWFIVTVCGLLSVVAHTEPLLRFRPSIQDVIQSTTISASQLAESLQKDFVCLLFTLLQFKLFYQTAITKMK